MEYRSTHLVQLVELNPETSCVNVHCSKVKQTLISIYFAHQSKYLFVHSDNQYTQHTKLPLVFENNKRPRNITF